MSKSITIPLIKANTHPSLSLVISNPSPLSFHKVTPREASSTPCWCSKAKVIIYSVAHWRGTSQRESLKRSCPWYRLPSVLPSTHHRTFQIIPLTTFLISYSHTDCVGPFEHNTPSAKKNVKAHNRNIVSTNKNVTAIRDIQASKCQIEEGEMWQTNGHTSHNTL